MAIFDHNDDSDSDYTCPATSLDTETTDPFIGTLSFHHFNMILSGACVASVCLTTFILMYRHATHLSKPKEQIKIMKICLILPLYTITSYLAICFPHAAVYITPWMDAYQALALGSFFLLLCEFISADYQCEIEKFFLTFEPPRRKRRGVRKGKGSGSSGAGINGLDWYMKQSRAIFQYPVIAVGVAIATDVTEALDVYCLESNNVHFAHIWLTIIDIISLSLAIISILLFYKALKTHLAPHKPLAKLLAFKLIVGLAFLEKIIFSILRSTSALSPSSTLSKADTEIGIPQLVICLQMVPFALFFPWAYRVKPYIVADCDGEHDVYQGARRAWLGLVNPMEILRAMMGAVGSSGVARGRLRGARGGEDGVVGVQSGGGYSAGQGYRHSFGHGNGYGYGYGREPSPAYVRLVDGSSAGNSDVNGSAMQVGVPGDNRGRR